MDPALVLNRSFGGLDHHDVNRAALRVELQPELLLNRSEEGYAVSRRRGRGLGSLGSGRSLFRRPCQIEVERTAQACFVHDWPACEGSEIASEI